MNAPSDPATLDWLLAAATPSIRALTLRHLLHRPESAPDVQAARAAMRAEGPIPAIYAGQTENGSWSGDHGYYGPKYVSTHWSMMLLTELDADGDDPRYRRGVGYMLEASAHNVAIGADNWQQQGALCFWGNLLRYAAHGGMANDARTRRIRARLVQEAGEYEWRCPINYDLSCAWGAVRALWGLAAIPDADRTPEERDMIRRGLDFLLAGQTLVDGTFPPEDKPHPIWQKLNFPTFYQADTLFVLRVAGELGGLDHPGARAALDRLVSLRRKNGRWQGRSPFSSRTWRVFGGSAETARWVTLHALRILNAAETVTA